MKSPDSLLLAQHQLLLASASFQEEGLHWREMVTSFGKQQEPCVLSLHSPDIQE